MAQNDVFRAFEIGKLDREDLIGNSQKGVEGGLNGVAPANGDVTVEDLLEHFGIRNEALLFREKPLEYLLGIPFVGMRRSHQVHRNVRIEEDHSGSDSR